MEITPWDIFMQASLGITYKDLKHPYPNPPNLMGLGLGITYKDLKPREKHDRLMKSVMV